LFGGGQGAYSSEQAGGKEQEVGKEKNFSKT